MRSYQGYNLEYESIQTFELYKGNIFVLASNFYLSSDLLIPLLYIRKYDRYIYISNPYFSVNNFSKF